MTATKSKPKPAPATAEERRLLAEWAKGQLALHGALFNPVTGKEYELRGDCAALAASTEPQVILCGPSDTGKTVASCIKVHLLCIKHPKAQGAIVRKTYTSMPGSVLQTFARVAGDQGVSVIGGSFPSRFVYENGSTIWVGGMDNPEKVLSSERDFIYVNQVEELASNDWELLSTRTTGRNAVVPSPQLFGDCNPAGSKHWILEKSKLGVVRMLSATHRDNPTLYDVRGNLTTEGPQSGTVRMARLETLTGVRGKRLFKGLWVTAEGAVYDTFDASVHVRERPRAELRRFFLAVDEGYTNPAVVLLVGADTDERHHVLREFYEVGKLQAVVVAQAREWFLEFGCEFAAVDESAAGLIADLTDAGVAAKPGKGRVLDGVQKVQNRLQVQGDGSPRLTVDPSCVNLVNEMESYVWKPEKDVPVKENDHACDAYRYLLDVLGEPTGAIKDPKQVAVGVQGTGVRSFTPRVWTPPQRR